MAPIEYPLFNINELTPKMNVRLITDNESLALVTDFFRHKKVFGLDVETNVVKDLNARYIRTIQVGDREEQYVIDLLPFTAQYANDLVCCESDPDLRQAAFGLLINTLRPALESREWLKIGHNLQFEYENLKLRLGLRPWHFYDTMLAEQVILCGLIPAKTKGYFALDDLMAKYGNVKVDKTLQTSFDLSSPLSQAQVEYAALDTRFPFGIMDRQIKKLAADGLTRTAQVEFDALPAFGDMRVNGFYCDRERWMQNHRNNVVELAKTIEALDETFIPVVGRAIPPEYDLDAMEQAWREETEKIHRAELRKAFMIARGEISKYKKLAEDFQGKAAINYGSPQQLCQALRKIGFKLRDTNDKTLEKFKGTNVIDLIRRYRSLDKRVDSYGEEFLNKYISPISGRLHSSINQIGAGTGRTSSNNPNVQNQPSEEEYHACFTARPGYKILTVDVQGCELRIAADDSNEPVWIEAFNKKWDVHSIGADYIFGEEWKKLAEPGCRFYLCKERCTCKGHNGKKRTDIKALNFGVIYGLSEVGYADQAGKKRTEARKDIEHFSQWVPILWKHLEKLSTDAKFKLESRTTLGRRRIFRRPSRERAIKLLKDKYHIPTPTNRDINQEMARLWSSIEREGRNAPIQGGNVDLMKLAMGCGFDSNGQPFLWHRLEPETGALLENLVHDELVSEAPDATVDKARN